MNLSSLLKDYGVYNNWANTRMADWLLANPAEIMEQEMSSSFPSIKLTLLHVWSAQDIWLHRLQGVAQTQFIATSFKGSPAQVCNGLLQNSSAFSDFLARQSEEYFAETTTYLHRDGVHYTHFNSEIIQHCLQHSTYHRGQVVTMARNAGLTDPPSTDFIQYVRLKDKAEF